MKIICITPVAHLNGIIQKLESFTKQSLCFIEYQISIKNPISCIDTL